MHQSRVGRKAVSTVIFGIIILAIFLSAFTAMVAVSQEYNMYQGVNYEINQRNIDRASENLTAVYPGIIQLSLNGCSTCQYSMLVSDMGGVGVRIMQLYINSTTGPGTAGCTFAPPAGNIGPCVLRPSSTAGNFQFDQNTAFVNAGEFNHTVTFWLPFSLPNPGAQGSPTNSIWIVTGRGRIFTFQYPFASNPLALPAFTPNLIVENTKVAWYGSGGSPPNSNNPSCHDEGYETRGDPSVPGGNLYFVNPWLDPSVVFNGAKGNENIYIYVRLNNTSGGTLSLSAGSVILQTANSGANSKVYFIGGPYVGAYYPVTSTSLVAPPTVAQIDPLNPNAPGGKNGTFIALFQLTTYDKSLSTGGGQAIPDTIFIGTIGINNQAEDSTYTGILAFTNGIYLRPCTGYSP